MMMIIGVKGLEAKQPAARGAIASFVSILTYHRDGSPIEDKVILAIAAGAVGCRLDRGE